MKYFREGIAVLFLCVIVFGLWKWYTQQDITNDTTSAVDVTQSVGLWEKIQSFITKKPESDLEPTENPDSETITDSDNEIPSLHPDLTVGTLAPGVFSELIETTPALGSEQGDFALLIICDFDAQYCKELYESDALQDYQRIANNSLTTYFFGYTTQIYGRKSTYDAQHARNCAERLARPSQRTALLDSLFENPHGNTETIIENNAGLEIQGFAGCLLTENSQEILLSKNRQLKQLFDISMLPSLLFYNKKTGQWYLIPGLYQLEEINSTLEYIFE